MANHSDQMIGSSPALLDMMDKISRAAPLDKPMLVIGERGTGKEMIAARLHYLSNRWNNTYQKVNCAALPETLLESELFGYEAGAFTGAQKRRKGRFEVADDGSLFLDEIGTMSAAAQEKLLRVIEYGEFERVGGTETLTVNVRIIAATNIDLPSAAEAGEFRHDLLDRLAFDVITVPPLRERTEDIPVLAEHFGMQMASDLEWLQFPGFTKDAMDAMLEYAWPGNIRELKNVVERAIYCAWDGEAPVGDIIFDPFDSPYRPKTKTNRRQQELDTPKAETEISKEPSVALPTDEFCFRTQVNAYETELLKHALTENKYNQRAAAKFTGLSYDQFRHALKKHSIDI
ncbi:phage shock protein operon transcriptional activator [Kordiimonas sp. SCSIO 12603]|uniref:phage shock protein operon transcriptional activator n=1 Tax=Kordiimonas sp. SCSIO 12603 TaxID=2829596 RepID=UPI0021045E14|nr:phage shock protein operon transcriptional activator [Kordiimonas sp. SCSIO 12603]UTW58610.1 phage shock protein operon transcriptional activator [Kordiimonas sp. SCSIO 12603]